DWVTYLGSLIDAEADGLQSSLADGDNLDNQNDEDGVAFISAIIRGNIAEIQINASVDGYLNAWLDFNKNGSWADAGEQIFTGRWLLAGVNSLSFPVPATASTGNTYARFRFGSQSNLSFTGAAQNGEVEDYQVRIDSTYISTGDIWMQDTPLDTGVEPNPDPGPMWISEDIWVRNQDDGLSVNQKPVFHNPCDPAHCNWIYVRIRNRGAGTTPGNEQLRVYWSMAATGLDWSNDWVNNGIYGSEITNTTASFNTQMVVPQLGSGNQIILKIPWCSPNPANYPGFDPERLHICLLARIEGITSDPFDNIRFPEVTSINANVRNNNNIIWRNTYLMDKFPYSGGIFIKNPNYMEAPMKLSFTIPALELDNNFFNYGLVKITLGNELYDAWIAGGSQGYWVTLDTGTVINFISPQSWIGNILPYIGQVSSMNFEFILQTQPPDYAGNIFNCDIIQSLQLAEHDSLLAGQRITINTSFIT
ncbi:MAG: GEVED domain-containing protein, partial [Bacteroidota bacterium]